jgi:DtxR family Mn-dependent transcriptional regulator
MGDDLTPTLEDYLRAIYRIEQRQRVARPKDISRAQNVAGSTVTAALQSLADKDMINYEPYELITLTERGRAMAEQLAIRHLIVRNFLEEILALEPDQAEATTCDMEHAVNRQALERFVCFLVFVQRHAPPRLNWLDAFRQFIREGADGRSCKECVKEYMDELSQGGEE